MGLSPNRRNGKNGALLDSGAQEPANAMILPIRSRVLDAEAVSNVCST